MPAVPDLAPKRVLWITRHPDASLALREALKAMWSARGASPLAVDWVGWEPRPGSISAPFDEGADVEARESGILTAIGARGAGELLALFLDLDPADPVDALGLAERLLAGTPEHAVVLCLEPGDPTWRQLEVRGHVADRVLVLRKPVEPREALQLLSGLAERSALEVTVQAQAQALASDALELASRSAELERAESELLHQRLHDSQTQLPNRIQLRLAVEHALQSHRCGAAPPCALLHVDLDDFRLINSGIGNQQADHLLVEVARRLRAALEARCERGDGLSACAARLGADEFAVLLQGPRAVFAAQSVAAELSDSMALPWEHESGQLWPSICIGVAISGPRHLSADQLLRDAHVALHHAKNQGRGCRVLFDPQMTTRATNRLGLEAELRQAIESDQLSLQFQPIVELERGTTAGFEALLR